MNEELLGRVSGGEDLSRHEIRAAIDEIMDGKWTRQHIGLLLMALRAKGESVEEITGAAAALREKMTTIRTVRKGFLDTCGTGGDGSATFNISTAAAIVAAAAGLPVAKHGNRSVTSKSGSSEVLAELGVNIEASVSQVERCLDRLGICFCYAPLMHPSMKVVADVRRELAVPTIFNLLGPLCNPASAPFQLMGVGRADVHSKMSGALRHLGIERAAVVRGEDGLDEVTTGGITHVYVVTPDGIEPQTWTPEAFGVARADKSQLRVDGPRASADQIRRILSGEPGPARDIVVVNAAAALWVAGRAADLATSAQIASQAIDAGHAERLLAELSRVSHEKVQDG